MKSTHLRSDFTRRQAHFTLRSNISPTRRVDFVEKSTSEEVLFSGWDGWIRTCGMRESKSRALPLGYAPKYRYIKIRKAVALRTAL